MKALLFILAIGFMSLNQATVAQGIFQFSSKPANSGTSSFYQICKSGDNYGVIGLENGTGDLYFHLIDSLGQIKNGWVENTSSVSTQRYSPKICSDGLGGFIVVNEKQQTNLSFSQEIRAIDSSGLLTSFYNLSPAYGAASLSKISTGYLLNHGYGFNGCSLTLLHPNLGTFINSTIFSPSPSSAYCSSNPGPVLQHSSGRIYAISKETDYYGYYSTDVIHILDSQLNSLDTLSFSCSTTYSLSDLAEDSSGNIIFCGIRILTNSVYPYLASIDTSGNLNWFRYVSKTFPQGSQPKISIHPNGEISMVNNSDFVLHFNDSGYLLWAKQIFPLSGTNAQFFDLVTTPSSSIIFNGFMPFTNQALLFSLDSNGNGGCADSLYNLAVVTDNCSLNPYPASVVNYSNIPNPLNGFTPPLSLASTNRNPLCISVSLAELDENDILLYPNPASDYLNITGLPEGEYRLKLFSPLGQLMIDKNIQGEDSRLSVHDFPPGIYSIVISDRDNTIIRRKIIVDP